MNIVKLISTLVLLACSAYLITFTISNVPGWLPVEQARPSVPNVQAGACSGKALCIVGRVTAVIDGDTLEVDGTRIRLALVNTPEKGEPGYKEAKEFTERVCAIGVSAVADQDDGQPYDKYGRVVAKVTCDGVNLNAVLLENGYAKIITTYCSRSEFGMDWWAREYGCG